MFTQIHSQPAFAPVAKAVAARPASQIRDAGVEVHIYKADVINRGEGGPTCLTRPLWREA